MGGKRQDGKTNFNWKRQMLRQNFTTVSASVDDNLKKNNKRNQAQTPSQVN
jgi:hypothetical protein